ncbi:Orf y [Tanacetum coccineum]
MPRLNCPKCQLTTCALCARNNLGKTVNVKGKQPHKPEEEKDFHSNERKEELWQSEKRLLLKDLTDVLKIIDQLKTEQIRFEEQKDEEIRKLKTQLRKKKEKETESRYSSEEFLPLENSQIARLFIEAKVTRIKTSNQTEVAEVAITELERLKHQGYIGEEPLKHWKKNGKLCKLDIINPDITIKDQPLKHVTPAMEDSFKKHVDSLLKIGAIRPSKSRHRTMAMIVNSGTTIDPATGREIKGKERMVFNYKSLNDNTYKDQYSLPGINTIIKRVGGAKIFSKFDLKSGFHQVAMDEESIPWTAFLVPGGLYEWLVMPFGLKNAPAVFQRKMDKCFKGTESFIAVYIDDILVFSKNEKEHAKHLEKMLKICEDNGLVLSPTKMKIEVSTVVFWGGVIGEGTIKLQPHIIKKIVNFN